MPDRARSKSILSWICVVCGVLAATPSASLAQVKEAETEEAQSDTARERAFRLAREGRCAAALPELTRIRATDPRDAEASLLAGQCSIRQQQYAASVSALEDARRVDPHLPGLELSLAIAHYHLDDLDRAEESLRRAEARDPARAAVQLYRGLLLVGRAEHAAGVAALDRARR